MKNILTEALVNSTTNASFIFSYTNSAKLRFKGGSMFYFVYKMLFRHGRGIENKYSTS